MNKTTAKEVREYLNYLFAFKQRIKYPMSLEIDEDSGIHHIFDGDGKPVALMTKQIYDLLQEV